MLTMRNWMFIKQYAGLREHLLSTFDLRALGDLAVGAFDEVPNDVLSVVVSVFHRVPPRSDVSVAQQPTPPSDLSYDRQRTARKRAATLAHVGRHEFDPAALKVVPEWPLVYWWDNSLVELFESTPSISTEAHVAKGLCTGDDVRLTARPWEPASMREWSFLIKGGKGRAWIEPAVDIVRWSSGGLTFALMEEVGRGTRFQGRERYFHRGVAFSMIGNSFAARAHRFSSVFGDMGASVFTSDIPAALCAMNTSRSREILVSLNPGMHFQVGDVSRLPLCRDRSAARIVRLLELVFVAHESHREPSVEFRAPGPSPWRHAQAWAQTAVDRPEGAPLPEYVEELDPEPASDHVSFALGVALGRFGANGEGILDPKTGWPVPVPTPTFLGEEDDANAKAAPPNEPPSPDEGANLLVHALPHGLLFLDRTLDDADLRDGLGHPAANGLHEAWATYGPSHASQWTTRSSLRDFLALDFFKDVHKGMYENRPIHWPISSEKKTFVAWVNIHRMDARTLKVLLADHLLPRLTQIEGELADLRAVRDGTSAVDSADPSGAKKAAKAAEKLLGKLLAAKDELETFVADVAQCAERGPLPTDPKCPPRERDAAYDPDLDDGVMINSSALWKLLEPQWKDPKKWWKELASAAPAPEDPKSKATLAADPASTWVEGGPVRALPGGGRGAGTPLRAGKGKDYDWSHLAMRYFPTRVDEKCRRDPSLGVAHGCFWRYHPERAWAWELRLQDEIGTAEDGGPFRIREAPYRPGGRDLGDGDLGDSGDEAHRATFLRDHPDAAIAALEKEAIRRMGRGAKRKRVDTFELHEPGLWSQHAATLYELELTLSERQGHPLTIHAPDEPEARAAYERAHPEAVTDRTHRLTALKPLELLGEEDDDESAESEGETDDGGDDDEATED
jgi:hypothetical protein